MHGIKGYFPIKTNVNTQKVIIIFVKRKIMQILMIMDAYSIPITFVALLI